LASRRTRLLVPGFAFCAVLFVTATFAADSKPVREFDVSVPDLYERADFPPGPYGIKYLAANQLAIWFTDNTAGELSRRGQLRATDPWRLKLHIIDTSTGAARNVEWPTHKISNGVQVQADGTVVVLNGPVVRCLSPDLKQFGSVELPDLARHSDERILAASPGGRSAWVFDSADQIGLIRVDTSACKLTANLRMSLSATSLSASDDLLVATDSTHIGVRALKSNWAPIYQPESCCVGGATFANQSTVIAFHEERNLEKGETNTNLLLLDPRGKLLLETPMEKNYKPGSIVSSSTGQFALVVTFKPQSSTEILRYQLLTAKYRLVIYDLRSLRRVAQIDVSRNNAGIFVPTISPDGRQAAVLVGSKVFIYDIPPSR